VFRREEVVIFFRRIARGVGGFVRRAAPVLRTVARVAAPAAGFAAAAMLARRPRQSRPQEAGREVKGKPEGEGLRPGAGAVRRNRRGV
jgi:hypothetical protein